MDFETLVSYLEENDVQVWVEAGELRYRGDADRITPLVLGDMARNKTRLVDHYEAAGELDQGSTGLQPRSQSGPIALSVDQESLWFLDQLHGGNPSDHLSHALRLTGPLDISLLEKSLSDVVARHEILRTTFHDGPDGPGQVVHPTQPAAIALRDLSSEPTNRREAEARRICTAEFRRTFDLGAGPLFRAIAIRMAAEEWVLLLVVHHIAFDNMSFGIMFEELARFYTGYSNARPADLAELPLQYADYSLWQQEQQSTERVTQQVEYWRDRLAEVEGLELPTDHARPPLQSPVGTRQPLVISAELKEALTTVGRSEGASLYMTLLTATHALLHRYTGQDRIAVGGPVSVRNRPELEGLLGLFLNLLVFQVEFDSDVTFRELLGRVRTSALGAYANQDVPFERLVGMLQPDRDLSHNPLFQVMLQLSPRQVFELPGLTVAPFDFERGTSQFDLSIHLFEVDDRLEGFLEYDTDLFDPGRMQRMAGHLDTLLWSLVGDLDLAVGEAPLLTDTERTQLVLEWNRTDASYPSARCIHELFENQVAATPDTVALTFGDDELTYQALNEQANRLAHRLLEMGVGPDVLVGIALERSPEMMIAVLATLKAGGGYVPMDPSFPKERLDFMLADSRAAVVITADSSEGSFLGQDTASIYLDRDSEALAQHSTDNPGGTATPDNLAYVIYTSGSTGVPKGVMVPHEAVVNFVTSMSRAPGMSADDRIAAVTTLSFDIHVLELLQPLTVGATIVLVPTDDATDGSTLARLLDESGSTMMQATPATWRLLVEAGWSGPPGFKALCGGEALPPALATELRTRTDQLWNMYGPTETTVWSTCALLDDDGEVSIGRPIDNTQTYVLDRNLNPTPIGIPGELHIGGAGVTRGYFERGELTAERFVANPFDTETSSRIYKTGDLVSYRPDGQLDYVRRLDDQVKVRGFRIELGEIEAVLDRHGNVSQSAVVVREDVPGDKRLVGYVALSPGTGLTVGELRAFLLDTLPSYMVPSALVVLDALPLTPNGKVDKKALPEPDSSRPSLEPSFVAPRTESERAIAEIWQALLRVDNVGVHDNFFDLGGHSLLLMQMRSRLQQLLRKEIPLTELFRNATVSELSAALGDASDQPASATPDDKTAMGPVPVMPNVHRFLVERASPDVHHWNISVLLTLPEGSEVETLAEAGRRVILHHDALRLRFEHDSGTWRQWLAEPTDEFEIIRHDLSQFGSEEQLDHLTTITKELHETFDLAAGSLLRMAYFDLGPRGRRLFVVMHHLVADGLSWSFVLEDLETAFGQLSRGEHVRLPAKSTSVQAWAEAMSESAQSPDTRQDLDYWLSLPWSDVSAFPQDFEGDATDNTNGSTQALTVSLSAADTEILEKNGLVASTEEVLIASLARALAHSSSGAVYFERLGHGRIAPASGVELSRTVGFFLSYTPIVLKVPSPDHGKNGLDDLSAQIHEATDRSSSYDLLRLLSQDRDVTESFQRLPRAQLSFNFRGRAEQFLQPGSMFEVAPEDDATRHSHSPRALRYYPIVVIADLVDDQLTTMFVWSQTLHRRESIQALADAYLHQLSRIVALED